MLAWFDKVWFSPMPPERLAVLRMLIGSFAFVRISVLSVFVLQRAAHASALVSPVGLMRVWPHTPQFAELLVVVASAAVCGAAFVCGWRYRWTAPCFVLSLLTILSYYNSFGMLYHSDHLLVLHVGVLAFAPAADALSFDAQRRGRSGEPPTSAEGWQYGWPIRLICALTACVYLLAGIAKLAGTGWSWGLGEALRAQVAKDVLRKRLFGERGGMLGDWVLQTPWLLKTIGVSTLLMELGAPLCLVSRSVSRVWAVSAFVMHWGILLVMGIKFRYQLSGIAFLAFFPAEWLLVLARAVRARLRSVRGLHSQTS